MIDLARLKCTPISQKYNYLISSSNRIHERGATAGDLLFYTHFFGVYYLLGRDRKKCVCGKNEIIDQITIPCSYCDIEIVTKLLI